MAVLASSIITKDDGDQNYLISTDTFSAASIVVEIIGLPSTWELAGRLNVLVNYGTDENPLWASVQTHEIRPYVPSLIQIGIESEYRLMVRFVKYIKDCQIFIHDAGSYGNGLIPEPEFLLDSWPGASLFALEQLYSSFAGPFFSGSETDITTLQGTIYNAKPWDGIVDVSGGKLRSADEWTYLKSVGPVELSANRMVVGVLSVKGSFPDDNSRGMLELKGRLLFQVNGLNEIEVYAPRSDGQFGGVNLGSIPGDDQFFLIAFLVETNSLRCWINNQLVLNQFVDNIISADGPLEVSLRGVEWKMLATWDDSVIPNNPADLIQAVVNHFQIT
ncbi:hypothetical protein SPB21_27690 [Leptothoe sp. ISB3NOV94-8A]